MAMKWLFVMLVLAVVALPFVAAASDDDEDLINGDAKVNGGAEGTPVAAKATLEQKKFPGVKQFTQEHLGRYASGTITSKRASKPALTVFAEDGSELGRFPFGAQTKASEIVELLADFGILPAEKRRF